MTPLSINSGICSIHTANVVKVKFTGPTNTTFEA